MENDNLKVLAAIPDRIIAEEIQRVLEESGIHTLLVSDNPASSVLNVYMGSNPLESIQIQINASDYERAADLLSNSPYEKILGKA